MSKQDNWLAQLEGLNAQQLRRLLVEQLTRQKLGLYWESNAIARDAALNANWVLPRLRADYSVLPAAGEMMPNLMIEGDNFDALRLLKSTHAGKIRVIYIDPPYNTGNQDWVYNDRYVGANDRWRHSQWLEFLYRRLTLARDLLTPDGVIMVSINDENRAKLELLMDEVFPGMRVGSLVWKTRSGSNDESGTRFSVDHEHVLVYANASFYFNGEIKDFSQYKNPDNDHRGPWKTGDLSKSHTYLERPNGYYAIQNPKTEIWYPCNPSRVWAFASELKNTDLGSYRSKTMEQYIREEKVIFPENGKEKVKIWNNLDDLLADIDAGEVPVRPKSKTPLLTRELPDLAFWVGKKVGFGRPWFKRHLSDLQSEVRPISSWIKGATEEVLLDEFTVGLSAQRSGTGEHSVNEILGFNAFSFPKPPSLMRSLLSQATRPNDIVLDFFAGSGTTGQAVLELNAEDGGQRRFILCSSTEATAKAPDKNVCREVCAERMRRVIQGYGGRPGLAATFAYLQLDLIEAADAPFEASAEQAFLLLALRRFGGVRLPQAGPVQWLGRVDDCDVLLCAAVTAETVQALAAWTGLHRAGRLAVYSPRPETLREWLAAVGVAANCYALGQALALGQAGAAAA